MGELSAKQTEGEKPSPSGRVPRSGGRGLFSLALLDSFPKGEANAPSVANATAPPLLKQQGSQVRFYDYLCKLLFILQPRSDKKCFFVLIKVILFAILIP